MKKALPFFLLALAVTLLYFPILSLYFSQDDFFHFRISLTDGSLEGFVNLFSPWRGIYFYRPVFREAFYNAYGSLFGLNPLPYRLTQFAIHIVNAGLVYIFLNRLTKNRMISGFGAGVFALSAANVGILSFMGGGIQVSGMTLFFLLTLIFFLRERWYAFIFYILALASHELALAIPFVLTGLAVLQKRKLTPLLLYFLLGAALVLLEIKVLGLPTGEKQYGLSFSPLKFFNTYEWYFVWGLGVPEMLLDYFGPGIRLNSNLMKFWGDYFRLIFPAFLIVIGIMLMSLKRIAKDKIFWFFLVWFLVGISPVALLPLHRATYYLAGVMPAIGGILGLVFNDIYQKRRLRSVLFVASLIVLSFTTIQLSFKTYWAISRAKIAEALVGDIKNKFPELPKGAIVYYTNDPSYPYISADWGGSSKQASVVLSGSDALQVIYKDPTIKVYYEDLEKPPTENSLFVLTAEVSGK